MNIIDISWPITPGSTEYKNRNSILIERTKSMKEHGVSEHILHFHNHTGTHIDMPAHMLPNGATTTDIDLSRLMNIKTIVLDYSECTESITKEDILRNTTKIHPGCAVLLKTRNSLLTNNAPFNPLFIYLTHEAAEYIATKDISAIGIDYLGIERNQPGHPTHKVLLSNNIYIIEGLRLAHVTEGAYFLTCLPLAIEGIDAVPARAILIKSKKWF